MLRILQSGWQLPAHQPCSNLPRQRQEVLPCWRHLLQRQRRELVLCARWASIGAVMHSLTALHADVFARKTECALLGSTARTLLDCHVPSTNCRALGLYRPEVLP